MLSWEERHNLDIHLEAGGIVALHPSLGGEGCSSLDCCLLFSVMRFSLRFCCLFSKPS